MAGYVALIRIKVEGGAYKVPPEPQVIQDFFGLNHVAVSADFPTSLEI